MGFSFIMVILQISELIYCETGWYGTLSVLLYLAERLLDLRVCLTARVDLARI